MKVLCWPRKAGKIKMRLISSPVCVRLRGHSEEGEGVRERNERQIGRKNEKNKKKNGHP